MEKEDQSYKEYILARNNIKLVKVSFEEVHAKKYVESIEGDNKNSLGFSKRVEFLDIKNVFAYLKTDIQRSSGDSEEIELEISVICKGEFLVLNSDGIEEENLKRLIDIQAVPQLLPYVRSMVSFISSTMSIPPIEIPTMDIIESIRLNREKDMQGGGRENDD